MTSESDRRLLEQLRSQLAAAEATDAETRETFRGLGKDVERMLGPLPPDRAGLLHSFRTRLHDAVQRFETTHPELTSTMAQVVDQLGMWGI